MKTIGTTVLVKRSKPGLGLGLFAAGYTEKGTRIVEYTGKRIPAPLADALKTRYVLEINDEWAIDGASRANVARYINHSCGPNCEGELVAGRVFVRSLRDIQAGEELTLDYGDEYFDEFIKPIGCKCRYCVVLGS